MRIYYILVGDKGWTRFFTNLTSAKRWVTRNKLIRSLNRDVDEIWFKEINGLAIHTLAVYRKKGGKWIDAGN